MIVNRFLTWRAAKLQFVSAITSVTIIFTLVSPASAINANVAPVLPNNSELYAVGYSTNKVGKFDTTSSQISHMTESVGDAGGAEGAGFDALTSRTWIMQDCEIFTLNSDGSTFLSFTVPSINNRTIEACWGFTPIGDGTAYLSGRLDAQSPDPSSYSKLFKVSLLSGEILGNPITIRFSDQADLSAQDLEPVELAYNSATFDLWVSSYSGYIYRLDPISGSISRLFDGFVTNSEWSWGMAVDSNNVLWIFLTSDTKNSSALVTLAPDKNWERYDFPSMTYETDAMWIHDTTPKSNTGRTINITTNCDAPIDLTANVGDIIVFTLTHDGCSGNFADDTPAGNFANFNNLNGTYFTDVTYDVDNDPTTPNIAPYQGNATGAGFLTYISHTGNTKIGNDYWGKVSNGSQNDWYVLQTRSGGEDVVITTVLNGMDGNGTAIQVGSVIANIFTEPAYYAPNEFLVRYAGPRTVQEQPTNDTPASEISTTPVKSVEASNTNSTQVSTGKLRFNKGQSNLSKAGSKILLQSVNEYKNAQKIFITASAGYLNGLSKKKVERLALRRANTIKTLLIKSGIDPAKIIIQLNVVKFGVEPKSNLLYSM